MKISLPKLPRAFTSVLSTSIIVALLVTVSIGMGLWLFIGGIQSRLVSIQLAQGVVQASESQQELIRQSRDALAQKKSDIVRLEALFVPLTQDGIVGFVEALEGAASSTAITLSVTAPQTLPNPEGPYAQSFEISMTGSFSRIFDMIALLEQSGALKRFDTLEISAVGEEFQARGTLQVASQ